MPPVHSRADQGAAIELLPGAVKCVDAATRHFAARGYHGSSVRDIAADAQMTVAGLYHHFSSKQGLLQWIMVEALRDVLDRTRTALAAADADPRAQLRAVVLAWLRFHTERQAEALIGASELRSLDPAGRQVVVGLRDEQEALFRGVVEDGRAAGIFTTPYPIEAVRAIITMGYSVASWFRPSGPLSRRSWASATRCSRCSWSAHRPTRADAAAPHRTSPTSSSTPVRLRSSKSGLVSTSACGAPRAA